jgi:hypothetical protein
LKGKNLVQVSFQLEGDYEERKIQPLWFEVSRKGKNAEDFDAFLIYGHNR